MNRLEGIRLDARRSRLEARAVANGSTMLAMHADEGISGKRADNRPGLQAALAEACETKSVLVTYSLARLARSTRDTLAIAERLERAGADLASLTERIDTTTAAGKMVFRMLAVLAEFERDQISERNHLDRHSACDVIPHATTMPGATPASPVRCSAALPQSAHRSYNHKLCIEMRA